jgi:hypothetical protein
MLDNTHVRSPIATAPLSVLLLADRPPDEDAVAARTAWQQQLASLERPGEILLVRPRSAADVEPEPLVITYEPAEGMRSALRQAIDAARHPLVVFCTCDRQYQPADLGRLLAAIDQADFVVGYRARPIPAWLWLLDLLKRLLGRILLGAIPEPRRTWLGRRGWGRRGVARWVFGLRLADAECPYRLVRREVLTRLPLQSRGPFVHVELLAKANHLGCLLAEEPVAWSPPVSVVPEVFPFAAEARALFRSPDFGPGPQAAKEAPLTVASCHAQDPVDEKQGLTPPG